MDDNQSFHIDSVGSCRRRESRARIVLSFAGQPKQSRAQENSGRLLSARARDFPCELIWTTTTTPKHRSVALVTGVVGWPAGRLISCRRRRCRHTAAAPWASARHNSWAQIERKSRAGRRRAKLLAPNQVGQAPSAPANVCELKRAN